MSDLFHTRQEILLKNKPKDIANRKPVEQWLKRQGFKSQFEPKPNASSRHTLDKV